MISTRNSVGVCAVGEVDGLFPNIVAAHVSGYFNLKACILPALPHPTYAFDPNRLQYDAAAILAHLKKIPFDGCAKVIAVVAVDLFIPIFTHVFGEARQGGTIALVSTFRLTKDDAGHAPPAATAYERTAKVALHELAHLFNLGHCSDRGCLLHFSGDLQDLDETPLYFCRYCWAYFRDAVK
jgi:archaemetzincin